MQTENKASVIEHQGWTLKVMPPVDPQTSKVLLLIHGRNGNESVMWIFARKLMGHFWILSPRGPYKSADGGYDWVRHNASGDKPKMIDFQPAAKQVIDAYPDWLEMAGAPALTSSQSFNVMGFSQGGAMSFALAYYFPERVNRIGSLAGFLPATDEQSSLTRFSGKEIFIAHGTRDETIPIELARQGMKDLTKAGAQVTYCESDAGHKLSLNCLKGLEAFFAGS